MSRCSICIHDDCIGEWQCIGEQCAVFNTNEESCGCGCVLYNFDINEDCPLYESKEVTDDTGSEN